MDEERIAGWVARINRTELATLNATVQGVQRVIGDRRSSFAQLSEVLLRDAALSARLLKVANSPAYGVSAEPVTTVTRAATL
ncbi:MAG: HDOD domain-containing protein, partial [Pseudomonadales bacterium]|nr:HDOD domain-containing protein [Pseudomonadales bacterium]